MKKRRTSRVAPGVASALLSIVLAACGGSGSSGGGTPAEGTGGGGSVADPGGDGSVGGNDNGGTQFITETQIEVPGTTRITRVVDPQGTSQADLSAATYMIRLYWNGPNGSTFNNLLGTGFAIGGDLIATNAHVSAAILNQARQLAPSGITLARASALRAETGEEIPLLEALVHPSYNGSTRSPDIGLFVARAPLPVALELATDAEVASVRSGDAININGFPGDVDGFVFFRGFDSLSIPRATFFSSNVQSLQKFDERSVIDPNDPLNIDMFQHGADTSGGTSGSPILIDGKVIGIHNSGLGFNTLVVGANGEVEVQRTTQATASWGVHVKHLKNLLAEYRTGVMEVDKRYRLPVEPALLQLPPGQSSQGPAVGGGSVARFAGTFGATVTLAENADSTHTIGVTIGSDGNISGSSSWPPNSTGGARQFTLTGTIDPDGLFEIRDDTPERFPGFRRGFYRGNVNAASGTVDEGEYYELDETTNELFYFGSFDATVQ